MKTKYSFEIMDLDDARVAVPVGKGAEQFHAVLKLNDTAEAILKLLEDDCTEADIVDVLLREYDGEKDEIGAYVHEFLERLKTEGIVE